MLSCFQTYFSRFETIPRQLDSPISDEVGIIVAIPCYDEPDVLATLRNLQQCARPSCSVEVLVVVNHSEAASDRVKQQNARTVSEIAGFQRQNTEEWIRFLPIASFNLPKKQAGVGLARKIAMDEAMRRFSDADKPEGIILSLDADTLVEKNYFVAIDDFYRANPRCSVATLRFEHPLAGNLPKQQYIAIAQYELYLRYYVEQLRQTGFPYAFHTVGSAFSLRAKAYCRQGGMNKHQAGEDFYFLQKLFPAETVGEIFTTTVHPSSRLSDRVPFGTGMVITKITGGEAVDYMTFCPEGFLALQSFFSLIPKMKDNEVPSIFESFHPALQEFLGFAAFERKIAEIRSNSATEKQFEKRFFNWFNGFMVFKFLNFAHQLFFKKVPIIQAAADFLAEEEQDPFRLLERYRVLPLGLR